MQDAAPSGALPTDDAEAQRRRAAAEWQAAFDPDRQIDPRAIADAASRAPLVERDGRIGFEPVSFADLVTFIAEMPF